MTPTHSRRRREPQILETPQAGPHEPKTILKAFLSACYWNDKFVDPFKPRKGRKSSPKHKGASAGAVPVAGSIPVASTPITKRSHLRQDARKPSKKGRQP